MDKGLRSTTEEQLHINIDRRGSREAEKGEDSSIQQKQKLWYHGNQWSKCSKT